MEAKEARLKTEEARKMVTQTLMTPSEKQARIAELEAEYLPLYEKWITDRRDKEKDQEVAAFLKLSRMDFEISSLKRDISAPDLEKHD